METQWSVRENSDSDVSVEVDDDNDGQMLGSPHEEGGLSSGALAKPAWRMTSQMLGQLCLSEVAAERVLLLCVSGSDIYWP